MGYLAHHVRATNGKQPGDPGKAAKAILKIAELSEPLLRLLLGSDAVFLARGAAEQRMAEDEKWRELSLSIDFEGIPSVEERLGFLLKS